MLSPGPVRYLFADGYISYGRWTWLRHTLYGPLEWLQHTDVYGACRA